MINYKRIVDKFCNDVLSGKEIAGNLEKLSVKRYLSDIKSGDKRGIWFDQHAAEHAIKFFSFLKHSKSTFAGKPFDLLPWEIFILWNIFGFKNKDGTRRFNYSYTEVARKNGKSTFASGVALYLLDADGEESAEVYCFATKEEQAKKTIFQEAKRMVLKSPLLNERIKCYAKSIFNEVTFSFLQPVGSDSDTQDGYNPHGAINDEYHAQKDDEMFNVMKSGMGARPNPLLFTITTAGTTIGGACHTERETCVKILKGILQQDNKFVIIFTLDDGDDWQDEKCWLKANPSYKAIPTLKKFLRTEYIDAKNNPSRVNNFKTKNLNIWCSAEKDFISDENWMKCAFKPISFEEIKGRSCYAGLDLAKRVDINALVLVFDDKIPYDVYCMFWIPESKLRDNPDDVNYQMWSQQGFISVIGDQNIDMDREADQIADILNAVNVQSTGIDIAMIEFGVGQKLSERGIQLTAFRQGYISMTPPINELEALVMGQELNHGGNPVLRWMNSNVALWTDPAGNRKIHKGKSKGKVDGMVALVMAIGEMMAGQNEEDINTYYRKRMKNEH